MRHSTALRVLICGALLVAAVLTSVPRAQATAPFFFIQLSDPQFGMFTADKSFVQETANFEFAVANINRLKPAFIVITGDLVNKPGDASQIVEYRRVRSTIDPAIPVYDMPGNHDVENAPTPATVAAYNAAIGRDHYTFTYRDFTGVVLDSTLIHTPANAPSPASSQEGWLRGTLEGLRSLNARHVVVFQHHPWFLKSADEPDQYFNIPLARRTPLLALFREAGVSMLVSGHLHENAVAAFDGIPAITTAPTGMPLNGAHSGMRVFVVKPDGIAHRFFAFGEIPPAIDPATVNFTR